MKSREIGERVVCMLFVISGLEIVGFIRVCRYLTLKFDPFVALSPPFLFIFPPFIVSCILTILFFS
ncbi:hypothetical protein Hanom_Chr03g00183221 [Helianthus anomalus]